MKTVKNRLEVLDRSLKMVELVLQQPADDLPYLNITKQDVREIIGEAIADARNELWWVQCNLTENVGALPAPTDDERASGDVATTGGAE
jgi:hypothetical protein